MTPTPDHAILALLGRRDPRGFDQAYERYGARLFTFLTRLLGRDHRHLAEDLLQQTFLRLAEHGPELRPDSDLRAWLYTVARNAFLGQLRGRKLERDSQGLELVTSYSPDAEDRELLLLVGAEGLPPLAVSRLLGIEPATMRKRLERARQRLLQELERAAPLALREASS